MQWRYLRPAPRYPRPRPLSVQPSLGPPAGQWCIGNVPTGDATLPHTNQSIRSPLTTCLGQPQSAESQSPWDGVGEYGSFPLPHFPIFLLVMELKISPTPSDHQVISTPLPHKP